MSVRLVASRRQWCLLLNLLGPTHTQTLMRKRCLLGALLLVSGCFDGGPFAPRHVPQNPCHPGQWYEVEQTLVYCPIPNR